MSALEHLSAHRAPSTATSGGAMGVCKKGALRDSNPRPQALNPNPRGSMPNIWVLGIWVIVIIVQVLGKYMIIGYLDP